MNNKYFRVDDIKVADIMSILLNEKYYSTTNISPLKMLKVKQKLTTQFQVQG